MHLAGLKISLLILSKARIILRGHSKGCRGAWHYLGYGHENLTPLARTFSRCVPVPTTMVVSFIGEPSPKPSFSAPPTSSRNIKGFMIQTGDPSGTGKGGDSIWGGPFNDEIRPTVKVRVRRFCFLQLFTASDSLITGVWWPWQTLLQTPTNRNSSSPIQNSHLSTVCGWIPAYNFNPYRRSAQANTRSLGGTIDDEVPYCFDMPCTE